ncbi:hypothetical protein [Demequina sp. NBRC 110051]|uniref:hypothetical protein n=1 Tax=Demequina sp. NBRC 110051 TaxID=1570340 RepID=UPI000A02CCF4|nr:hypothetical protein [Demequina sp. NBRC 110051]
MKGIPSSVERIGRSLAVWDPYADVAHAHLLTGSGRSGTTWLLEAYARAGRLRPIFEPFRPDLDARFEGLRPGRYVPVDAPHLPGERGVHEVLTGKYRYPWTDQEATLNPFVPMRGRLVKEIRGTTWAGWIARRYPELTVLHVMRHPLASLSSQSVLGWSPERFAYMLSQDALVDGLLGDLPVRDLDTADQVSALVGRWAVENVVAARTYGGARSTLISYDVAVEDPSELHAGAVAMGIDPGALADLSRPSRMTHSKGANAHAGGNRRAWVDRIDADTRTKATAVLEAFGLRDPFGDDGAVDAAALRAWWDSQAA